MSRPTLKDVLSDSDLGLLDVHPVSAERAPELERAETGLNEISRFVDDHGRVPKAEQGAEAHEKRLARRLQALRSNSTMREALAPYDRLGLLRDNSPGDHGRPTLQAVLDDPDLDLGEGRERSGGSRRNGMAEPAIPYEPEPTTLDDVLNDDDFDLGGDLHELRHVTPWADREKPEYVARQKPCQDFETFKPLLDQASQDLETGRRRTLEFKKGSEIQPEQLFIVRGLLAYVAERKGGFYDKKRNPNARLRVIYSNGTESDLLLRSFSSALYNDPNGRRLSGRSDAPIFGGQPTDDDIGTGLIYVLKSLSENPEIIRHQGYLHKIGVTSDDVSRRIRGAEHDPTFLMAPVEVVATFRLYNVNRTRLEHLLHTYFDAARAEVEIKDRFGQKVRPREWFFIPLEVIREAVQRVGDGSLIKSRYDPSVGRIVND